MLLRCLLIIFAMAMTAWTSMCPEPYVCTCHGITMNCTCNRRENVTLSTFYNFDIRHVVIERCGTVFIPLGAMAHLPLDSIELNDLERLHVFPFALAGLPSIDILRISNVQNMEIESRAFSGLFNISTISISNVSWDNVNTESFGGVSSTENFVIADSEIGTVESLAFILNNITKFSVKNSHFGTVENMSLLIHGSEKISFEDCTFQDTGYSAFSMSYVDMLSFQRCSFELISTSGIFAKNVGSFIVNKSSVSVLQTQALRNIEVLNKFQFTDNTIILAERNSLYLGREDEEPKNLDIKGNMLTCDCNLTWLWENEADIYEDFIESSFCIGSSDNIRVSSMSWKIRSESRCSELNDILPGVDQDDTTFEVTETDNTLFENGTGPSETNSTLSKPDLKLKEAKIFYPISSRARTEYSDFLLLSTFVLCLCGRSCGVE